MSHTQYKHIHYVRSSTKKAISKTDIYIIISTKGNKSSGKFKVESSDTHYTFQQPHQENEEEEQEQEEQSLDEIYSHIKGADVEASLIQSQLLWRYQQSSWQGR